jgi:TetR/AcrR family transcriptional regulator, cholesterol catabolism regulator
MSTAGLINRRDKKRAETLERIFSVAMRLFSEKGFQATTVDEIAERADVAKGTFFNYFPTKEHVLEHFSRLQLARIERAREQVVRGENLREVLLQMVKGLYEEASKSRKFTQGFLGLAMANPEIAKVLSQTMQQGRLTLALILEQGRTHGELKSELSDETLAAVIQRTMFGTLTMWAITGEGDLMGIIDENLETLWAGFGEKH